MRCPVVWVGFTQKAALQKAVIEIILLWYQKAASVNMCEVTSEAVGKGRIRASRWSQDTSYTPLEIKHDWLENPHF